MIPESRIDELLALDEKRTPGEWHFFDDDGKEKHRDMTVCSSDGPCDDDCLSIPHCHKCIAAPFEAEDAAFIAAAPELAAALRQVREERDRMREDVLKAVRLIHVEDKYESGMELLCKIGGMPVKPLRIKKLSVHEAALKAALSGEKQT